MPRTVFLKFDGVTIKASCEIDSKDATTTIFQEKFPEDSEKFDDGNAKFYVEDAASKVWFEIEDYFADIYDGAIIEARFPESSGQSALQKELASLREKITKLEATSSVDSPAAKRRKLEKKYVLDANAHVVRIRGLPWGSNEQTVTDFFDGLAIAKEGIHIVTDWQDRPNGEAYIQFDTVEDMNKAKQRHNDKLGTRYIEVFPATGTELYRARVPPPAQPLPLKSDENVLLKLRGFPFGISENDVVEFLHGTPHEKVHMGAIDRGTFNGEAYVEFGSEDDRQQALKYDRSTVGSRYIEMFKMSAQEAQLNKFWTVEKADP